jgi:enamine deaminase RidA (YjgF/YER057c/UK114 family)
MAQIDARLKELGLVLPSVAPPVAAYVPAVQAGDLVYVSGQLPTTGGQMMATGLVGRAVMPHEGYACAKQCALNALAAVKDVTGDLDRIVRIVKVTGYVASAEGFCDQPKVINGASEVLGSIFGDAGQHARAAVGVSSLPLNAPVEVELIVQIRS